MPRITLTLPVDLEARARRRATEKGISLTELIQEALSTALQANGQEAVDPLFADTAVFTGQTPPDLAGHHDRYLYGEEE
jgi:hypothetical protein